MKLKNMIPIEGITKYEDKPLSPKEKAIELVERFKPLVTTWDCYMDCPLEPELILKDAKTCAAICVNEILQWELEKINKKHSEYMEWIKQVNEEINNL